MATLLTATGGLLLILSVLAAFVAAVLLMYGLLIIGRNFLAS